MNETTIKKEIPIMVGTSVLFYLLALDKQISALDGFILIVGIILFLVYCFYVARYDKEQAKGLTQEYHIPTNKKHSVKYEVFLTMSGIIGIILGARLMVDSAISIARGFGLSELFIGMTIVAVGTSVPELATSMVAAFQKKDEISVGNVVGSNIFNIGMVVGIIAMISPFSVEEITLKREFLIMLAFSVALFLMVLQKPLLTRTRGLFLLIGYSIFIWLAF
jgi:cation:H+ antiporter